MDAAVVREVEGRGEDAGVEGGRGEVLGVVYCGCEEGGERGARAIALGVGVGGCCVDEEGVTAGGRGRGC